MPYFKRYLIPILFLFTACEKNPDVILNKLPDKKSATFFIFQKHSANLEIFKPLAIEVAKNLKKYGWEERPKIFFRVTDYGVIITHQTDHRNRVSIIIFDMQESYKTNFETLDIVFKARISASKKTKKTDLINRLMVDFLN